MLLRDGGNERDNSCYDNDDHVLTVKEMPKTPPPLHWRSRSAQSSEQRRAGLDAMAGKSRAVKSARENTVKLEGKRKKDNAWYECEVSLSSSDTSCTSLYVHYASFKGDENDIIVQKDEAFARLRVRSRELSKGECLDVEEGEAIIALQKTQSGRTCLFDAVVEKVMRLKHSNKVVCRCTFEIRWLESEMKGNAVTVPASSIRRLAEESIQTHPTISSFLEKVQSAAGPPLSPEFLGSLPEDSDIEIYMHARIEQQIEEIAKLAETSENAATEEISFKHIKVNATYTHRKVTASAEHSFLGKDGNEDVPVRKSSRKRNTRNSVAVSKEPVTLNAAALLQLEKRPRLTPLAARAALAASVWDFAFEEQNNNAVSDVFMAKKKDSINPIARRKSTNPHDEVPLDLSDTYFEEEPRSKNKKVPKSTGSTVRSKPPKQSSSNKFCANQVDHGHANMKSSETISSKYSKQKKTHSVPVSAKQETSSACTAEGSSATAAEKALLTKQSVKKRQRQANKDVSSTRSKEKHSGLGPTRSSPRFHVVSSCDNQQPLGSLQSVEIEKNEENNRTCVANTVTGRISRKGKKQPQTTAEEPECTVVLTNPLQVKNLSNDTTNEHHLKEAKEGPEENGFNGTKNHSKVASIRPNKNKHLLNDDCENITEPTVEGLKDHGSNNEKLASDNISLDGKRIKRPKIMGPNHVESSSIANDAHTSLETLDGSLRSKRASKAATSKAKLTKKSRSPVHLEKSNGGYKTKCQSPDTKMNHSQKGEDSRKDSVIADNNLKAQARDSFEKQKQASKTIVVRSSPRLRSLQ